MITIKSTATELALTGQAIIDSVVLVGGTANSAVVLTDGLTSSGTDKIELKCLAYDSKQVSFGEDGLVFDTGIYNTLSGSGAKVYVYLK